MAVRIVSGAVDRLSVGVSGVSGAAELMLESLAALVGAKVMGVAEETAAKINPHKTAQSGTPRGDFSSRPLVRIHVHEEAKTGRKTS
jgi:hypothetical protein